MSSARYSCGVTRKSVWSKKTIAARTSSSGVGRWRRPWLVCHSTVISSRIRRRRSRSWRRVSRGSSKRSSSRYSRRCATRTVRRRASVGWAVSTGRSNSRSSSSRRPAVVSPERSSCVSASAMLSGRTPARSRFRSVRTRCFSSARLISRKYAVNARATASSSSRGRSASTGAASSGDVIVRRPTTNGGSAELLDELEERLVLLLDDDLAQQGTDELDLAGEGITSSRAADASRLGAAGAGCGARSRHAVLRLSRGPRRRLRSAAARRRPRYSLERHGLLGPRSATTCRRRAARGGSRRRRR